MLLRVLQFAAVTAALVALTGCPADPAVVGPGSSDVGHAPDTGRIPDAGPICVNSSDCPLCQKCLDGACLPEVEGDDMKDECPAMPCATGACDGKGACGLKPATEICRPSAGDCDVAESCTGEGPDCPTDLLAPADTVCRAAAGDCDLPETCSGVSALCPSDNLVATGVLCRAALGECDLAESCTGDSPACPIDLLADAAVVCRASAGECDVAESCTGTTPTCPADALVASDVICRPEISACDITEYCTGTSATCPADAYVKPAPLEHIICRSAVDLCDVDEWCTGNSPECPADAPAPSTVVCRHPAGFCDAAEYCDGASKQCPADVFQPTTTLCRGAADTCDLADYCDGAHADCPVDTKAPADTICGSSSCVVATFTPAPTCDGAGKCLTHTPVACGDYFCNNDGCENTCESNAQCTTGFCDSRDSIKRCVPTAKIFGFDCSTNHNALRDRIEGCPTTEACYLKPTTSAACNPIYVANKDVFVTGALISPESLNYGGPLVTVVEGTGQITRFAMSDSILRGALDKLDPSAGTLPTGFALLSSRTGTGYPEVYLDNVSIGSASFPNTRGGIAATNTQLDLRQVTLRNSANVVGLYASSSNVTIKRSAFLANPFGGIELQSSQFTIESSAITGNGYSTPAAAGVTITSTPTGARHVFRYNTVAENAAGMSCSSEPPGAKTVIDASLFWNDAWDNAGCEVSSTSDVRLSSSSVPSPTADACANGLASPGLLVSAGTPVLLSSSPCIDKVPCDPAVEQLVDFLGQARPYGTACDVGAVEYRP